MSASSCTVLVPSARQFLESVLVWPASDQAPGWINVHVNSKNNNPKKNGGKPWVADWPFKIIDEVHLDTACGLEVGITVTVTANERQRQIFPAAGEANGEKVRQNIGLGSGGQP